MSPRLFVLTAILILAAAPFTEPAEASSQPTRDAATPEAAPRIQLAALMAPVRWPSGRQGTTPVTPVLDIGQQEAVDPVCALTPRIRDAVITALYETPIPGSSHNTLDLESVKVRLTQAVNAALGRVLINGIDLVAGVSPATVSARFFNSIRCAKKAPEKKKSE